MKVILATLALCLHFSIGAANASELITFNFNEPPFHCTPHDGEPTPDNRVVRLPKFAPNPASIRNVVVWSETVLDYPTTMTGNFSIGIDPGGAYTQAANYPANQNSAPLLTKFLGAIELRKGKPQFQTFDYSFPVTYHKGDVIIVAPECIDTGSPQAMISLIWAVSWEAPGPLVWGCDVATRLMIGPESDDGPGFVTDASLSNHQIITTDVAISTATGSPSMLFNGTTSVANFVDGATAMFGVGGPIQDTIWPGDFTVDGFIQTTDASMDTQYRHILSGGSAATSAAFAVNASGQLFFGNESSGAVVTGTSNIADGALHHVAVTRSAGILRLFVDGVVQATAADSTVYSSSNVVIGRYAGANGGHWHGHIKDLRIINNVAKWTTNFTPPSGPAC